MRFKKALKEMKEQPELLSAGDALKKHRLLRVPAVNYPERTLRDALRERSGCRIQADELGGESRWFPSTFAAF